MRTSRGMQNWRIRAAAALFAAAFQSALLPGPVRAQSLSEQIQTCGSNETPADLRIAACTVALDSGRLLSRATLLVERAHGYLDRDEPAKALNDFDEAMRLAPSAESYFGRGVVLLGMGAVDRGIADFDEGLKLAPRAASGYFSRGLAYRLKDNLPRALDDFNEAIALDPKFAPAYAERSYVYRRLGKCAEAAADRERATQLGARLPAERLTDGNAQPAC